ncbi:MAG: hypothetical protein CVV49_22140 [Spirochaetae bacterium HGW-Spirochaetae-5]|nr:MAG: hypothetical protein CVV49_22140 [Spirochaetae bacterium HGW-Spirochaetae-5]
MKYKTVLFSLITFIFITLVHPSLNIFNSGQLYAQDNVTMSGSPVQSDDDQNARSDSLYATFRQGGLLMWPILLLGILGCTIIIERLIYFYRNRKTQSSVRSLRMRYRTPFRFTPIRQSGPWLYLTQ